MVMLKIGNSIVSEEVFIGIDLTIRDRNSETAYVYEASWNYGNRVMREQVHAFYSRSGNHGLTIDREIEIGFKTAMKSIKWNEFMDT